VSKKYPWGTSRRYNAYVDYLRSLFGERVQKVIVNAGFSCPNRDGSKGFGGCIYCNNDSFKPPYCHSKMNITEQINAGIEFLCKRYKVTKFLVYFQPFSNTYAPLSLLQDLYKQALSHPKVIGLSIGTRSDCIDEEKLDFLAELARNYYVTIEYGLESPYNKTLKWIRRMHDFKSWENAVQKTAIRGIHICTHLIMGFPYETKKMMLNTARIISNYPLNYIKIHHLHIVKNTILEKKYKENPFPLLNFREYVDLVIGFLQRLRSDIQIQRLVGETHPSILVAPDWDLRADVIQRYIEKELESRDVWQGKIFDENIYKL
jgi:radical SAM protein (TIGR01212 family)